MKKVHSKKIFNPYEYENLNTISSLNNPESDMEMTNNSDAKKKTSQRGKKFRASDHLK